MKNLYSREEMLEININTLKENGVTVEDIASVAFMQQSRYMKDLSMKDCIDSVEKILSLRDIFHHIQLGAEIDRLATLGMFKGPIQDILLSDLGLFGIDELVGLDIAGRYGVIGQTNFGDIDVNKPGIVNVLNEKGKNGQCFTFLDDIVGAIAAAASTRVAQMMNEEKAHEDPNTHTISIFDID